MKNAEKTVDSSIFCINIVYFLYKELQWDWQDDSVDWLRPVTKPDGLSSIYGTKVMEGGFKLSSDLHVSRVESTWAEAHVPSSCPIVYYSLQLSAVLNIPFPPQATEGQNSQLNQVGSPQWDLSIRSKETFPQRTAPSSQGVIPWHLLLLAWQQKTKH